jgi:hypothetical protein
MVRRALVLYGTILRAEARAGLVYGPYLTADSRCSITTARGGSCTKLRRKYIRPTQVRPKPRRGKVREFSRRSRTRLQQTLCAVPIAHVGRGLLFITLTYPRAWPGDWLTWKRQLDTLGKRMKRQFPNFGAVWKLEPQKRGAPHFHLLVVGVPFIAKDWLSRAWFEIVQSGDARHLAAGTQVQLARSHRGVVSYAAKYTAKREQLPASWQDGVGRFWGVIGREQLGIVWRWVALEQHQYFAALRIIRRLIARRGRSLGRSPPSHRPAGTWAVLPDWQALRIARCVLHTENRTRAYQPHERTPEQTVYEDCLSRRHLVDQPVAGCVCAWRHEPLPNGLAATP